MWEFWKSKSKPKSRGRRSHSKQGHSSDSSTPSNKDRAPSVQTVNFKDLNLGLDDVDGSSEEETHEERKASMREGDSSWHSPRSGRRVQRNKLIIILVGLPGRGKTFLANKIMGYLNWLGHDTRHFNVGMYRRVQKENPGDMQDAAFFDHNNQEGREARERALLAALADLTDYLATERGQVAIFDATNTTEERRRFLISQFHGKYQYLFVESICDDPKVLENNYKLKMMYSPDYQNVSTSQALDDFHRRIDKYSEVYEPIEDRNIHYIKLINMVTGRGHMDINRISGYIPGKIVFFLMQICKAGMASARKIFLSRHGQSQWNLTGKLGGDSDLTGAGQDYAWLLPEVVYERVPLNENGEPVPLSVWTSTLRRTINTAQHLPFPKLRWKALDEIHAGVCDGMTYEEVAEKFPEEYAARKLDKLCYRYPAGESYLDVIQRLEPVITEMERERESVMVVGHQAVLRVIYSYFMKIPLERMPTLSIPLNTLIELTPRPDGTMLAEHIKVDVESAMTRSASQRDINSFMRGSIVQSTTSPGSSGMTMPIKRGQSVVREQPRTASHVRRGGSSLAPSSDKLPPVGVVNAVTAAAMQQAFEAQQKEASIPEGVATGVPQRASPSGSLHALSVSVPMAANSRRNTGGPLLGASPPSIQAISQSLAHAASMSDATLLATSPQVPAGIAAPQVIGMGGHALAGMLMNQPADGSEPRNSTEDPSLLMDSHQIIEAGQVDAEHYADDDAASAKSDDSFNTFK